MMTFRAATSPRVRRRLRAAHAGATVLAAGLAAGCGEPTSPLTPADVTGTYALSTVGGRLLPWAFPNGNGSTLVADTLTLAADGTWTEVEHDGFVASMVPGRTASYNGTWTFDAQHAALRVTQSVEGAALTSVYQVGGRGARLAVDTGNDAGGGRIWVYVKVR